MPICNKCNKEKKRTEFNFNSAKQRLEYHCKTCHSEYLKQHYQRNKIYYKTKAFNRQQELLRWYKTYKSELKCEECGEDHPACLDFHHKDRANKEFTIPQAVNQGWGIKRIKKEIAKCKVLCCKCHRILHYEERLARECDG
jgi:hypothetical protein